MSLTDRQVEVLRLLCKGLENKHIAARLNIGESTVESHRRKVMVATKSGNAVQLGVWAHRQGLV
jgi:DNA-binding NarL/FixJ family response regulator